MKTAIIFGFGIIIVVLMYLIYCKTSTELDSINDIKQDIQRIVDRGSKIEEEIDIFRDTENNHDKIVIEKFIDKELQLIMEAVEAIHAGAKIGEAICCDLSSLGTLAVLGMTLPSRLRETRDSVNKTQRVYCQQNPKTFFCLNQ